MGANNHPTTRPEDVSAEIRANRIVSDLEDLSAVREVRAVEGTGGNYRVSIELQNPRRLDWEVMGVLADHEKDIRSGCIENGMNPFNVYVLR